ncbi:MAG TPA: hypothetical protein VNO43_11235 [Candidatus Eisenbacteria bacterium]|nr:hypothetical protein [Candidatus Eisenbacteria bacterium]
MKRLPDNEEERLKRLVKDFKLLQKQLDAIYTRTGYEDSAMEYLRFKPRNTR